MVRAAMGVVVQVILSFPTVVYTVALGVAMLYWASVMLGALDLDVLGGADGGADGAHEGLGDGGADVGHHGGDGGHHGSDGGDGDAGDADGDGDNDGDAQGHGGVLTALAGVSIRRVPMTVALSTTVIVAWLLCALAELTLAAPARAAGVPMGVFDVGLLVLSLVVALRAAGVAVRPLAPLFAARRATRKEALVGRLAEVSTARLDGRFGQVLVGDGGAGLLLDARYEGDAGLRKGDRVVVTHWDAERGVAHVEPIDRVTGVRAEGAREDGAGDATREGARAAKRQGRAG